MRRKVMRNPYRAIYRTALLSAAALGVSVAALLAGITANLEKEDMIPVAREPLEIAEEPAADPVERADVIPGEDTLELAAEPAADPAERADVDSAEREPLPEPLESLGTFLVTSYCPCPECCGIWSAQHPERIGTDYTQRTISGTIPQAGRTVGVDPDVIPLGTHIIIAGQEYVAEDAGASKGNVVEIYFDTHAQAMDWPMGEREVYLA